MSGIFYKNRPYAGSGGGGGGASALSQLSDVSLSSPSNGQILKYNGTSGKWENANESGGGGSYTETVLYTNLGTTRASIVLSDDYTNYDQLYFECVRTADQRSYVVPYYMPTSSLSTTGYFQFFGYNEYCSYGVADSTNLTLLNGSGNWYIKQIIGIKF